MKKGETNLHEAQVSSLFGVEKSRFRGPVSFLWTRFKKSVIIEDVVFEKTAAFVGAEFGGFTLFKQGTFCSDASFTNVAFEGIVAFQGVVFEQDADFSTVRGRGNLALTDTIFEKMPNFCQAHFDAAPAFDGLGPVIPSAWSSRTNEGDDELFEPQAKVARAQEAGQAGGGFPSRVAVPQG